MTCSQLDAYRLMHDGAVALAQVEAAGIRVDVDYLEETKQRIEKEIREIKLELQKDNIYRLQVRRFGEKTNLTSRIQLADVLTKDLGLELPKTEHETSDRLKTDQTALEALDLPYCRLFLEHEKLNKLLGTYILGLQREVCDGFLHSFFNLHTVTSFRGSSDSINFQNIPVRNERVSKEIRSAFIPRDGHVLVEIDYAALEFRVAACFWKDPAMIEYASDPTKDIHRDCAAEIYKIPKQLVSKQSRYCAKNMFVFPELYGDFYISCARACWEAIDHHKLKAGEVDMLSHLRSKGITLLGELDTKKPPMPQSFEGHMKKVERTFYEWFPVLKERRDSFWNEYRKNGYFDLMTGFRINGIWRRNFVLNAIIQGPAFHLLLWSLIQLVKWTKKNRTKTRIVGQIHDCILADVHRSELEAYIEQAKKVMTQMVRSHYDWVVTPLEVEVEVAEDNWHNKKRINA